MGRRYDPERRQRLIDAAIEVVADRGIPALSHRAVAAAADVPLGSTTYHFASLDDLLVAALRQANDSWLAEFERWERELPENASLAAELALLIERMVAGDRRRVTLEYELYLAALRHERLRPIAAECLDRLTEVLQGRVEDQESARTVAALMDGTLIELLITGRQPDLARLRAQFERVLG